MLDSFLKMLEDPDGRARLFRIFYAISLIFLVIGYAIIIYYLVA